MIQSFPTPDALADAVARHIAACAKEAISARGRFIVALSGGSTPGAAYSRLATRDSRLRTDDRRLTTDDWHLTHIFWGDERCVPPDDPRSNYRMAKETLLDRVPIPAEQIHRIRGEEEPQKAAADYERELRRVLECHPERSEGAGTSRAVEPSGSGSLASLGMTSIDLVLLGLGEDGHTASLFPCQPSVHETERWAVAVLAPDRKLWRVTLTPAILNQASNVTFVVSGANKAQTLQRVLEQPSDPDTLPAQAIRPIHGRVTWMVDQAAAGRLEGLVTRDS
jgi:6-phosphogluconolactonase